MPPREAWRKTSFERQEIFPEGYETKLLMTGLNVSPNDRFYILGGIAPGNGKLKIDGDEMKYKDDDIKIKKDGDEIKIKKKDD